MAGAAAGGYAGSKIQKNMQDNNTTQTVEQRCRTVYDSVEKPNGYEVRYRLDGQERTVMLDYDPGRSIPVENGLLVLQGIGRSPVTRPARETFSTTGVTKCFGPLQSS